MWSVALGYGWWPYQTSVLQDHAWQGVSWLLPLGQQSTELTHQSMHNVLLLSRPILLSYRLLRPWFVCLLAVAYGDSSTMSQAEVPLEGIHAFYWEMGPFTDPCWGAERDLNKRAKGIMKMRIQVETEHKFRYLIFIWVISAFNQIWIKMSFVGNKNSIIRMAKFVFFLLLMSFAYHQ